MSARPTPTLPSRARHDHLSEMRSAPHTLTDVTLVLGPPLHDRAAFDGFQALAARGDAVAEHSWARHEYEAIDALTVRDGALGTHTLLETLVGGVVQASTIIADVDRRWVWHEDGRLYAAITFTTEDVRPRAVALALQQPEAVQALEVVSDSLSALDGRAWLAWSSRTWADDAPEAQGQQVGALVARIAETVLATLPPSRAGSDDAPHDLLGDLLVAIRCGVEHADRPQLPLAQELRALRHLDPLRVEWQRLTMDAFFLAAQPLERLETTMAAQEAAGLAFLYVGKDRTDRLKADPCITPRFRGELAARAFMTAYALHRLAPRTSQAMLTLMTAGR